MKPLCLAAVLFLFPSTLPAQQNAAAAESNRTDGGVYYAAFRTSAHIARSSPDIFHSVSQDLLEYLKSKGVRIVADPERGVLETSDQMSTQSMMRLAKLTRASSLLLVTVDRPFASWLKITVQSFDENGKQLWEENADKKGGVNGKTAPQDVEEKIKRRLAAHIGKEGLPMDSSNGGAAPGNSNDTHKPQ